MSANLAEAIQLDEQLQPTQPNLVLVPNNIQAEPTGEVFVSADDVPELVFRRRRAGQEARNILAQNSHLLHNGRVGEVPAPSDPLGTAHQVIEAKEKFGEDSPEHRRTFTGLVLDDERLAGEVMTKNDPAYFERVRREFMSEAEGYSAHGLSISRMTRNGLTPLVSKEDQERRIKEHVEEEGTYVPIGSMIARHGLHGVIEMLPLPTMPEIPRPAVQVTTISECSDEAIAEFMVNPKGSHAGMRPGMRAIALRRTHFEDEESGHREDESLIIDGTHITHEVIQAYLLSKEVIESGQTLSKTDVLGTQLVSVNGGPLLNFARELDDFAGTWHGKRLYLGREVADDYSRDYTDAVNEAELRDQKLGSIPVELAEFQVGLAENGTDSKLAESLINKLLKDRFMEVAKEHPQLAAVIFDEATAVGLARIAELEAQGKPDAAKLYALEVYENAPDVSFCSGGSCKGLEDLDPNSVEGQLAQSLGLKGKAVRNKVAACKNCHEKGLAHDYHGNTVCTNCKSRKLRGKRAEHTVKTVSQDEKSQEKHQPTKAEKTSSRTTKKNISYSYN